MVSVSSTLAMGPPVGYWVSTMISAVPDGLKYKTVEEDDEDTLGASSTRWRLTHGYFLIPKL